MMGVFSAAILVAYLSASADCQCTVDYYLPSMYDTTGVLITSDGFPDSNYPSSHEQCWQFSADVGPITITFQEFDTESSFDYFRVYTGNVEATYEEFSASGSSYAYTSYTSLTSDIYVTFTSDGSAQRSGFQACVCAEYASCSCNFIDTSWSSWSGSSSGGLALATIIGIGVSLPILVLVPIIVGISVACCCMKPKSQRATGQQGTVTLRTTTVRKANRVQPRQQFIIQSQYPGQQQPMQVHGGVILQPGVHPNHPPVYPPTTYPPTGQPAYPPQPGYTAVDPNVPPPPYTTGIAPVDPAYPPAQPGPPPEAALYHPPATNNP